LRVDKKVIKKLKKTCWVAFCDRCGDELGDGYVAHYETKKLLLEDMEEIAEIVGKNQFCSPICYAEWCKKS
jgi:hypothetical protein